MNQNVSAVSQILGPWRRGTQVEAYRQQCRSRFQALPPAQQASIIQAGRSLLSQRQTFRSELDEAVLAICLTSCPAELPSDSVDTAKAILRKSTFGPWQELASAP